MELGRVTLVFCQLILRVLLVQLHHIAVTADLCQDRCRADAGAGGIALDHRLGGDLQRSRDTVAIHQHKIRHNIQPFRSLLHAAHSCVQDIIPVDDLRAYKDDLIGQRLVADLIKEGFSFFLGQLLGVVDAVHRLLRVKDTGRHNDRAAQRAAARFVHTGKKAVLRTDGSIILVQRGRDLLVRTPFHSSSSSAKSARSSRWGGRSSEMRPHLQARNSSTSIIAQRSVFTSPPRTSRPRLRPMASSSS